jgi:hypothetical protein
VLKSVIRNSATLSSVLLGVAVSACVTAYDYCSVAPDWSLLDTTPVESTELIQLECNGSQPCGSVSNFAPTSLAEREDAWFRQDSDIMYCTYVAELNACGFSQQAAKWQFTRVRAGWDVAARLSNLCIDDPGPSQCRSCRR